jgi:hypothetical protein
LSVTVARVVLPPVRHQQPTILDSRVAAAGHADDDRLARDAADELRRSEPRPNFALGKTATASTGTTIVGLPVNGDL